MAIEPCLRVGVDTGGTFTDVVALRHGRIDTWKLPSTPAAFERAVLEGAARVSGGTEAELIHSSTVATNALLERRGARTALVTTRGFRDVLEIGRQDRLELYSLSPTRVEPLVPRERRFEVTERVNARGEIQVPLAEEELPELARALREAGVESVAVVFLFSFLHPEHERRVGAFLEREGFTVSLSHEVLPEFREYERSSTTVANAYVRPAMASYLGRLADAAAGLGFLRVSIVQSNGGTLTPARASALAVNTLLSGPAAGIQGLLRVVRAGGQGLEKALIGFDMGGTSTDVSLLRGAPELRTGMRLGGYPIAVPMVDVHTVGAGGGSIASVDAGGALVVGPASAGADPGPACHGRGGPATVTDAHVVLGHLKPDEFLGGRFALRVDLAHTALAELGRAMGGISAEEAARGVLRLVNLHMENAIRVITVQRGHDPAEYTLAGFGGAGGLHVFFLAEALGMTRVLLPCHPGVLSALGAAASPLRQETSQTLMWPWDPAVHAALEARIGTLADSLRRRFAADGLRTDSMQFATRLDLRYRGQSHELTLDLPEGEIATVAERFHALHRQQYGHAEPSAPLELVTLRVAASLPPPRLELPVLPWRRREDPPAEIRPGVWRRDRIRRGDTVQGPARILEDYATHLVPPGWKVEPDVVGNLIGKR